MKPLRAGWVGLTFALASLAAAPVAQAYEPNEWICVGSADRPNPYSEDIWGTTCTSPDGGTYAQLQGFTQYNDLFDDGTTYLWFYVWNGKEDGDEKCNGRMSCSAMLWIPDGAPHQYYEGIGDHPFTVDFIVSSMQVQCLCE